MLKSTWTNSGLKSSLRGWLSIILFSWVQTSQAAAAAGTTPNTPPEVLTTRSMKRTSNIRALLGGTANTPLTAMETATRNPMMINITTQAGIARNTRKITADPIPLSFIHFEKRIVAIPMNHSLLLIPCRNMITRRHYGRLGLGLFLPNWLFFRTRR